MNNIRKTIRVLSELIATNYLTLVLVVTVVGFLGSMYFSEVLAFAPCKACWYQRVTSFPIIILTVVAQLTKSTKAYILMIPLTMIGMFVSMFQVADESLGTNLLGLINCNSEACEAPLFKMFGIFDIPTLALLMFIALNAILLITAAYHYFNKNAE